MRTRILQSRSDRDRLGFTLIELLVVIVILGILISLLVPAVMRAVGTAQEASCAAEIRALGQALTEFKTKSNCFPPSRILISENGDYSIGSNGNIATGTDSAFLVPRSISYLRRIWPRLQFNTSTTKGDAPVLDSSKAGQAAGKFYDVNGDGVCSDVPYVLDGTQCLVLFLGGIPQANGSGYAMTGFSKNPVNPFQTTAFTTNRTVPLFEFNNSRLDGAGFPGYIDSFGKTGDPALKPFYAYFSSYEGVGYDPDDVNGSVESDSAGNWTPVKGAFTATNAVTAVPYSGKIISSPYPNPYTNDTPVTTAAGGGVGTRTTMPAWQNGQTYQIISSGRDRLYGIGGQYLANGNDRLPFVASYSGYVANSLQTMAANNTVTGQTLGPDARTGERDNVTNFSPGKLD